MGLTLALACSGQAVADDDLRSAYYQRAADHDRALFESLDVDRNGVLSRDETQGDLDLGPRFNDIDVNRDNLITADELRRYVEQRYGASAAVRR
jgi:plasmid stability protein